MSSPFGSGRAVQTLARASIAPVVLVDRPEERVQLGLSSRPPEKGIDLGQIGHAAGYFLKAPPKDLIERNVADRRSGRAQRTDPLRTDVYPHPGGDRDDGARLRRARPADPPMSWADRDQRWLWHPFTQMSDWLKDRPLVIERAEGSYLIDTEGNRYLDRLLGTIAQQVSRRGGRGKMYLAITIAAASPTA